MTTHAPTFTPRYRAKYLAAGIQHTIQIRSARDTALSTVITNGQTCLHDIFSEAAAGLADDFAWLGAEVCDQDTDIFAPAATPAAVTGLADFVTEGWSPVMRVRALVFSGRAPGSRARVSMYGFRIRMDDAADEGGNGVITVAEIAFIGTIKARLDEKARAGSGAPAIFYPQATVKENDKLLKAVRRGTIG